MKNVVIKNNCNLNPEQNTVYYLKSNNDFIINLSNAVSNIDLNISNDVTSNVYLTDYSSKRNLIININIGKNSNLTIGHFIIESNSIVTFNINILGEKSEVNFNSLLLARLKEKTNLVINTINKASHSVAITKVQCLSLNNAEVEVTANGHILKGMKLAQNHQKLNGLNEDQSLLKLNPILLIDEYDVQASHAAANGLPDENIIFYLMSRGLSIEKAKLLLRESLVLPFIEKVKNQELKNRLLSSLKGVFISG